MSPTGDRSTKPRSLKRVIREDALELGRKLRKLRVDRGYSTYQMAEAVGISQSKLVKLENAQRAPRVEDVRNILETLALSEKVSSSLIRDAIHLRQRRLDQFKSSVRKADWQNAGAVQKLMLEMEQDARLCRVFANEVLPGQLQTIDYMVVIWQMIQPSPVPLGEFINTRLKRQANTFRKSNETVCVISESVLRTPYLDPRARRHQLETIQMRLRHDGLSLGVIPSDAPSSSVGSTASTFDDGATVNEYGPFLRLSALETKVPVVRQTIRFFEDVSSAALWDSDVDKLITEMLHELETVDLRATLLTPDVGDR